jgi:hypothetical protein
MERRRRSVAEVRASLRHPAGVVFVRIGQLAFQPPTYHALWHQRRDTFGLGLQTVVNAEA